MEMLKQHNAQLETVLVAAKREVEDLARSMRASSLHSSDAHTEVLQSLEEELSRSRAHFAEAVQLVASTEQVRSVIS